MPIAGRQSSADRDYLAASLEAPHRDDIAKLLDENERVRSPHASVQLDARSVGQRMGGAQRAGERS